MHSAGYMHLLLASVMHMCFRMCHWSVYCDSVIFTFGFVLSHACIWISEYFSPVTDVSVDYLTRFHNKSHQTLISNLQPPNPSWYSIVMTNPWTSNYCITTMTITTSIMPCSSVISHNYNHQCVPWPIPPMSPDIDLLLLSYSMSLSIVPTSSSSSTTSI